MLKAIADNIKMRYRYAPWYQAYRVWHNFDREQQAGFRDLVSQATSFECGKLFAVGSDGILYDGVYQPDKKNRYLLKVALNKYKKRYAAFDTMYRVLKENPLPFLCEISEHGLSKTDSRYWYQVMPFVKGLMISQYLQLSLKQRLDICDPLTISIDLLEQTQALNQLRIIAPNIDSENVIIQDDRSLVRIDLDPYLHFENGKLPQYQMRRLFKLVLRCLVDFEPVWRNQIDTGHISCNNKEFETLFDRLRCSALYGYDDPIEKRHRHDTEINPRDCFRTPEEALELLQKLRDNLENSGALRSSSL